MFHALRILALALLFIGVATANDQIPGEPEDVALVGGTVHTVSGDVIENGTVAIRDGKISDDADGLPTIDVTGKHVYPGMIDGATTLGLVEISAVRATRDLAEAGGGDAVNPNAKAQLTYNPDSELIPTIRANGVLVAHVHPVGGIVSGQSALMRLDGFTYEEATVVPTVGLVVNWPRMLPRTAWWIDETPEEQREERDENLRKIETIFDQAEQYRRAKEAATEVAGRTEEGNSNEQSTEIPATSVAASAPFDIRLEAMLPALRGEVPVFINADEASQIEAAVAFGERRGLRMILLGGAEADKCVDTLKTAGVPVIITGIHRLPRGRDADIDQPGKLPSALRDAGIDFAIASAGNRGSTWPMLSRNLPYHAAEAAAHGLTREEALAAITLSPARILGVGDQLGSLEAGKAATLFVSTGDILDVRSNVTHAWIDGRRVDLSSRHTELRDKYRQRLERMPATRPAP